MEDTKNLNASRKDWNGNFVPKHTAKLIRDGIENGTAPFLPRDGQISAQLVYNANTGYILNAKDLIPVQLERAAKGYESNAVGTKNTMDSAKTAIKPGEKGVWYNFKGKDGEFHHAAYFFAEQTEHPGRFAEFAQQKLRQPQNLAGETIKIESSEAGEYLASYIAACKSGARLEVSPEIAQQFRQNMIAVCDNELKRTNAEKNPSIPKLNDVLFSADKMAGELVKSIERKAGISHGQKQQKNEYRRENSIER
ncbi:MAG: hypothetical protein K2H09_07010 [Treponemataceae bacterium]|nr:hypothetical protein [Treponemataceae bacterium]